ncbi:MAG: chloramphenicol resistance protein [Clostridia bacterium]|nr:chloramphenicol resistance protein [Clostridia bacterium]
MAENKKSIIKAIREFIAKCPYLHDGKIGVDYLENEVAYSIEPTPVAPKDASFIDDSAIKQFAFIFASRESYGQETIQNMLNTEFYEDFSDWIEEQNLNGNLPEIEGIETIECLSTGYAYQTGIDTARYQIQLRITYYK